MSPGNNTVSIYCPGCSAGDFPQPHICGITNAAAQTISVKWCGACLIHYTDTHWCQRTTAPPSTFTTATSLVPAPPRACEHCWCIEVDSGLRVVNGETLWTTKPHEVCCGCASRRVKAEALTVGG